MSCLHIFRGLPGSGKSTAARKLSEETGALLIEPDAFLVHNGKYDYTPERYHEACISACQIICMIDLWMGCDVVYADVLPCISDVCRVIASAGAQKCYKIHDLKITVEESLKRNRHNVRKEDIERMAREWEDWECPIEAKRW